jgi:hypothetical protein
VFNINKAEDKTMRVYFPIDAIDRRTGTLLHDVRQWVTSHSRAGWQITEENADNDDDNAATPAHFAVEFDDARDASDFWFWHTKSRRARRS